MGNQIFCMSKKQASVRDNGGKNRRIGRPNRNISLDDELLHRQALSLAIHQHQLSQRFDGSMSRRIDSTSSKRHAFLKNLENGREELLENVQVKKFILIHGEGFGAWCWYKIIALLEEAGLCPIALDLTASGINLTDAKTVTTLADYTRPLTDCLKNIPDDEKVILVGHSSGGACVSYALEHFGHKISKAVYMCATMISDGQRPFDVFAEELGSAESFLQDSPFLVYGNGKNKPPSAFTFDKQHMKGLYFNHSPAKDVALAAVSTRPVPLSAIMEKVSLTAERYGTGRRFFIETLDDRALSLEAQEKLVAEQPPEGVFKIKGSDHSPFFSKPQSLCKILLEIAQIP